MKLAVTYIKERVTQILEVVDQKIFDEYRKVQLIIPTDEELKKGKSIAGWTELTDEQKKAFIKFEKEYSWVGNLYKKGALCTTESPIYKAYLAGDGILRLQETQGGNHQIIINQYE